MTYLSIALILLVLYTGYYNFTEFRITLYLHNLKQIKSDKYKLVGHDIYLVNGVKIMRFDGTLYRWVVNFPRVAKLKVCDDLRRISNEVKRNA